MRTHRFATSLLVAALLAASVTLRAASSRADSPVTVRVQFHPRRGATFVDIDIRGTEVPIRLVRRIAGTCVLRADGLDPEVHTQIDCDDRTDGAVTFQVTLHRRELLVRRSPHPQPNPARPDGERDPRGGLPIIARGRVSDRAAR